MMGDRVRGSTPGGNLRGISVYNQQPKSTQSDHPSVSRRSEYQPKGGDALKAGMVRVCVAGKTA